jgi:hypothetical protein
MALSCGRYACHKTFIQQWADMCYIYPYTIGAHL